MGVLGKYTREIHKELGYFATWTPGVEVNLGDVGVVKGKMFLRRTSLKNLGIEFNILEDKAPVSLSHSSKGEVEISLKGSGSPAIPGSTLAEIEAGFSVKMAKENSILLKANNILNHTIDDQIALAQEILRRFKSSNGNEGWDKDWVVVTEVAQAESCTILVSKSRDTTVDITAKGELAAAELDIASAELGLSIKSSKSLETQILGETNLTPMMRLSKVQTKWFKKVFEGYKMMGGAGILGTQEDLNADLEALTYFGEIEDEDN